VAEILIAAGAEVDEPEADWPSSSRMIPSPMYAAATEGRADVVRVLIKHKAKLSSRHLPAPLVWAAFYGRTDVVQALLEGGARTEPSDSILDESALHVVARGALADMSCPKHVTPEVRLQIAKRLVDNGADVNAKADVGLFADATPLQCAAMSGHFEIARLLLDKGAQVNTASPKGAFSRQTPLHGAAKGGYADVVKLLLERQADVNALTGAGHHQGVRTPLDLADDAKVIKLLVDQGGKKASELTADE
jgi:ankyrin repeat protein